MARFVTGTTFGTTELVTAAKLNTAVNDAKISTDSVDNSTIELNSDALRIKDSGVTKAKIENVANMKVLGNTSGSATAPQEVSILDQDNMSDNSATSLATQQSIKAFVENLIGTADRSTASGLVTEGEQGSLTLGGGLIIKFGTANKNTTAAVAVTFKDSSGSASPFPNGIYGVSVTSNESVGSGAEVAGATAPTVSGFNLQGYSNNSNTAIGRCFFIAVGY